MDVTWGKTEELKAEGAIFFYKKNLAYSQVVVYELPRVLHTVSSSKTDTVSRCAPDVFFMRLCFELDR